MTTEVLRNMLYADSPAIDGLGYVVMDEVHYLADRFRGAVWEEVIIHLPQSVTLVSLSATVSNAEEFGDWLVTVRGHTKVVVSEVRPVPLWQHMLVGNRVFDLFSLRPAAHAGEHGDTAARAVHPRARRLGRRPRAGALRPRARAADRLLARRRAAQLAPRRLAPAALPAAGALRRRHPAGQRRPAARRSPSSSAATAATPPSTSACWPGCG